MICPIGATVIMFCEAAGIPKPIQVWYRSSERVSDLIARGVLDPARYTLQDGTTEVASLQITNVNLPIILQCLS